MGSLGQAVNPVPGSQSKQSKMDAIRKKMQSLKSETEGLYATIRGFEEAAKEATARADQADCDIRDYGKKVQTLEMNYDETNDKVVKATEQYQEADKTFKEVESDVGALTRRIMLMEEEDTKSADTVLKSVKVVESTCMNNEVTLEELDKNLRSTVKMAVDNEQKLDEMSRKLGVQEAELKRGLERAEIAEKKLKEIEEELESVGENMKQLEKSAEKAQAREEKLVDKILGLQNKYKVTEASSS